jgi:hypothetical protein
MVELLAPLNITLVPVFLSDPQVTETEEIVAEFFAVAVVVTLTFEKPLIIFLLLPVRATVFALVSTADTETVGLQSASAAVAVNVQVSEPILVEPLYVVHVIVQVPVFFGVLA